MFLDYLLLRELLKQNVLHLVFGFIRFIVMLAWHLPMQDSSFA